MSNLTFNEYVSCCKHAVRVVLEAANFYSVTDHIDFEAYARESLREQDVCWDDPDTPMSYEERPEL